ncbi:hypothetical protein NDU88_004505 [Pleurodeles waltl]|uniref:Uncharacterized protein n=1 Tax=Pleurodeles waltl TaxID=8319 RepID=A0AAV7T9B4_PLEWA|nr:hypothetical protein NDU88_004505 [Pleurodeles waltl]
MHTGQEPIRVHFRLTLGFVKPFVLSPGGGGGKRKKRQHREHQRQSRRQRQHQDHQRRSRRQWQHQDHQRHSRRQRQHQDHQWRSRKQTPVPGRGVQCQWCLYPSNYRQARRQNNPRSGHALGRACPRQVRGARDLSNIPHETSGRQERDKQFPNVFCEPGGERKGRD